MLHVKVWAGLDGTFGRGCIGYGSKWEAADAAFNLTCKSELGKDIRAKFQSRVGNMYEWESPEALRHDVITIPVSI